MMFPSYWKNSASCNPDYHSIVEWDADLLKLVDEKNPVVYNITSDACNGHFFTDFSSNIRKLLSTKLVRTAPCLDFSSDEVANHYNHKHDRDRNEADFPVIVTAASSNHYRESQALFKSIHKTLMPLYEKVKIIFYDLGLTTSQLDEMRKYCKCEVRKFPFSDYAPHVRELGGYAWKPIMIAEVLKEHKFVMYLDSCIRFSGPWIKNELNKIILKARNVGIHLQESPRWIVSNHTKLDTFTYFEEKECMFSYPELESGLIILYQNSFVANAIIRPWVACALTRNCMFNPYPQFLKPCSKDLFKLVLWTRCHRFDQSVLNIILIRIFNRYRKIIEFDGSRTFKILRGDRADYFQQISVFG